MKRSGLGAGYTVTHYRDKTGPTAAGVEGMMPTTGADGRLGRDTVRPSPVRAEHGRLPTKDTLPPQTSGASSVKIKFRQHLLLGQP